ncbi:MAG TPA: tetratricopeptide repeat protein, partial [Bryobacteraceae bacterium]|nr:tetratricopeptide repeat protein [Bryobacteraceae bacterium]
KTEPKNAIYMNMVGIAYLNLNNYDQAKKNFIRATKADKTYSSAVNNLGMVYYHQRNYRRAIREYQRAATIDPTLAGTHANLGFAYYNTNKFPEAATEFQKALELDPRIFERNDKVGTMVQDRSVSNHGLFFFTMAKVYAQKGDAAHCAEYLRKSLDEGYKDVGKAMTDPAFKDVINDPDVQAVMVRITPTGQKPGA